MPVIAKQTARVAGSRDLVVKNRAYADDDPVVRAHPWLFEQADQAASRQSPAKSTAELGNRSMSSRKRTVEQATAAPGEQRDTAYACEDCEFVGTSTRSVKAHRRQAH